MVKESLPQIPKEDWGSYTNKIRDLTLTKTWDLTLLKIGALTLYLSTDNLYL